MPTFLGRVRRQLGLPQRFSEITLLWTPIMELRTTYLDEGRSSTDEVTFLCAERDSAIEEWDSIAEDFANLCQNFDRMVAEHDSLRDELERVRSVPSFSFVALTLPGPSLDRIRDLERRVDCYRSEMNSARDECHELKEDVKGHMDRWQPFFSRSESLCEGVITILCLESVTVSGVYSDDEGSEASSTDIGGRGEQSYNRARGGFSIKEVTFVALFNLFL
ncbi:hypothetical protein AMTR_s00034p00188060 [Amborella trichopoda]|uniref:Uncharacterized protein n=1 Tax=Amborella trichopoda TaxID=13333 RepID=W1PVW4_AMBTC|nr:hypothetical protein AMTR_s00034p00188060 [Amborella trichopoda]